MADVDPTKSLNGLLNGIAQKVYYNNGEITEEFLKNELFPDLAQEEFNALHEKMRGLLKVVVQINMLWICKLSTVSPVSDYKACIITLSVIASIFNNLGQ